VQLVYVAGAMLGVFPLLFARAPIPWPGGWVGTFLRWLDDCLVAPNPVVWLLRAWQGGAPDWDDWALVVGTNGALGAVLLGVSLAQVRRGRGPGAGDAPGRWLKKRPWRFRPGVGRRPLLWKELFTRPAPAGLEWLARLLMGVIGWGALLWMTWAWAVTVTSPAGGARTPFRVFATLVEPSLVCIALLGVLVRGATCVSLERERGTWEGLLLAPVSAGEIITAKVLGCLFCVRWIWVLVGLLWSLGVASGQLRPAAAAGAAVLVGVLALSAAALGLLLSTGLSSSLRALTAAVGFSLVAGGGYLLCALPLLTPLGAAKAPPIWLLAPCVPFLVITSMVLGVEDAPESPRMLATCGLGAALYAVGAGGALLVVRTWIKRAAAGGTRSRWWSRRRR
jgi:hypothetical protein